MFPILLLSRFMVRLEILRRFAKGGNKDYAPMCPILLPFRFMVRLERLRRLAIGDNRD
jgi:hypothetical protein